MREIPALFADITNVNILKKTTKYALLLVAIVYLVLIFLKLHTLIVIC